MRHDSLEHLRDKITHNSALSKASKQDILSHIEQLQKQLDSLSEMNPEEADTIAAFAALKAHETLKKDPNQDLVDTTSNGLTLALRSFKTSHPLLSDALDIIFRTLSRLGV